MNYTVTLALPYDAEEIIKLEGECFTDPWSSESIRHALENDSTVAIAARDSDRIVGYAFMYVVSDESEILNIAAAPSERRRGIGSLLMNELLRIAVERGAATSYLEVRESNSAARSLYEKFGYQVLGKRRNYYRYPTEDAVLMAKILKIPGDCNVNPCN